MKSLLAFVVLLSATSAFARQYIQCSSLDYSTTDVAVVNLQTTKGGTLFISSGMQNDESERTLVKIQKEKTSQGKVYFKIVHDGVKGHVVLNKADIGKSSDLVVVDLDFNGYLVNFTCFSRIYND
ncbi:MAG: hypothetical protein ACOVP4_14885 [Bacteriovoracaceae bacterium]